MKSTTYTSKKQVFLYPPAKIVGEKLVIPISNIAGQEISQQTIYPDGAKRFAPGLKVKDGFFTFGNIASCDVCVVAEGYATAASLFQSLLADHRRNYAVVCAFSAANIPGVANLIEALYPDKTIIGAVDNGRAGDIAAAKCAEMGILSTSPDVFSDFNDVFCADEDVHTQLWRNLRGTKAVDRQWFTADVIPEHAKTVLVRSALGTGKTEALKELIRGYQADGGACLYIAQYQALASDAARRLGITDYLSLPQAAGEFAQAAAQAGSMAICINSLPKIDCSKQHYDVVVIDEAAQCAEQLTSSFLRKHRYEVWETLCFLLKKAYQVVLLDGTGTENTIAAYSALRGAGGVIVANEYKPAKKQTFALFQAKEAAIGDILEALQRGERVAIPTDTDGEVIQRALAGLSNKKGILINADMPEKEANLANINAWLATEKPDYFIFSPAIGTGVSIDGVHFDRVTGVFSGQTVGARLVFQMLHRVRGEKPRGAWLAHIDNGNLTDNADDLQSEFTASYLAESAFLKIGASGAWEARDAEFLRFWANVTAEKNAHKNKWKTTALNYFSAQGYTVTAGADVSAATGASEIKSAIKVSQAAVAAERVEAVLSLANSESEIDAFELARIEKALERGAALSKDEKITWQAHEIKGLLGEDKVTAADVRKLPTLKRIASAVRLVTLSLNEIKENATTEFLRRDVLLVDKKHLATKAKLLKEGLAILGVFYNAHEGALNNLNFTWFSGSAVCAKWQAFVSENQKALKHLRMIGSSGKDTVKQIGEFLSVLGIQTANKKATKNGVERREYSVKNTDIFDRLKPSNAYSHKAFEAAHPLNFSLENKSAGVPVLAGVLADVSASEVTV